MPGTCNGATPIPFWDATTKVHYRANGRASRTGCAKRIRAMALTSAPFGGSNQAEVVKPTDSVGNGNRRPPTHCHPWAWFFCADSELGEARATLHRVVWQVSGALRTNTIAARTTLFSPLSGLGTPGNTTNPRKLLCRTPAVPCCC